jgi:cyclic pyranopterin phosphate synthase
MMSDGLTHLDAHGRARMVDVGAKPATDREAVARGVLHMAPATLAAILAGTMPKGDVLATARIAGIMAAKRTAEWIPLCHPLALSYVAITIDPAASGDRLVIEATVRTTGPTGVEMEALTAVSAAALTLYDMCKAIDRGMTIEQIALQRKHGGQRGDYVRHEAG